MWADFVEIRTLIDVDGEISKADLLDLRKEARDLRSGMDVPEEDVEEDPTLPAAPGPDAPPPPDVQAETWAGDVFDHLRWRAQAFGPAYPFVAAVGEPLRRKPKLLKQQMVYAFLLLASNLRLLDKPRRGTYTSAFEHLCAEALKSYLPSGAVVHRFHRSSARYTGNVLTKLKRLAVDIRETFTGDEAEFAAESSGDWGLDIVGWLPFDDHLPGLIVVLAQCACSVGEWEGKQASVHPDRWRQIISLKHAPTAVVFVPFSFRRGSGGEQWHKDSAVTSVLIDRLRILQLLGKAVVRVSSLPLEDVAAAVKPRVRIA